MPCETGPLLSGEVNLGTELVLTSFGSQLLASHEAFENMMGQSMQARAGLLMGPLGSVAVMIGFSLQPSGMMGLFHRVEVDRAPANHAQWEEDLVLGDVRAPACYRAPC